MYPRDIRVENPQEALIVEQALAMYREMRRAAAAAPDGQVLSIAEGLALARGRELTRDSLQAVLQEEAREGEKKGARREAVRVAEAGNTGERGSGRSSRRPAR
jgi:hypothetical protein